MNRKTLGIIALIIMILVSATVVVGLLVANRQVPSNGTVKGINLDIFWDSVCTNKTTSIGWGMVDPSEIKSYTLYIKNTGNSPETLSLSTNSWIPSESANQLAISWNYNGAKVQQSDVVPVILTLTVNNSPTITDFNFNIVISGTG